MDATSCVSPSGESRHKRRRPAKENGHGGILQLGIPCSGRSEKGSSVHCGSRGSRSEKWPGLVMLGPPPPPSRVEVLRTGDRYDSGSGPHRIISPRVYSFSSSMGTHIMSPGRIRDGDSVRYPGVSIGPGVVPPLSRQSLYLGRTDGRSMTRSIAFPSAPRAWRTSVVPMVHVQGSG